MDVKKVTQAVEKFGALLPEKPVWMLLMNREGDVITQVGKYEHLFHSETMLEDGSAAAWIQSHSTSEIDLLDHLDHGNLQYSISVGTEGVFVILHIHGDYLLGMSYHSIGVKSLDALADGIVLHFREILDALFDV
ncbi:MAG: hypothetical protein ABI690_36140 [Chloroflexota bacterium]